MNEYVGLMAPFMVNGVGRYLEIVSVESEKIDDNGFIWVTVDYDGKDKSAKVKASTLSL